MALNGLFCADVPLRNYSLTISLLYNLAAAKGSRNCCVCILLVFICLLLYVAKC